MFKSFSDVMLTVLSSTVLISGAVFAIIRFLLKPVWAALNGYATAYAQQKASIDARISNLERLVEEQAHLTRAVETIKDEIAMQAKSRDNQWAFRKDVYVNILREIEQLSSWISRLQINLGGNEDVPEALFDELFVNFKNFAIAANVAPLAMSDSVLPLINSAIKTIPRFHNQPDLSVRLKALSDALERLKVALQEEGRKELWGDNQPGVRQIRSTSKTASQ